MTKQNLMLVDNSLDFSKQNFKEMSNDTKIISLDLESHSQLNELKINHEKIDTFLTFNDRTLIDNLSSKISTEWYEHPKINDLLDFDKLNLGSLLEHEILVYLLKKLKFFLGLIRLITNESPKVILSTSNVVSILKILKNSKTFKIMLLDTKNNSITDLNKITLPLKIFGHTKNISFSYDVTLKIIKIIESISTKFFDLKLNFNSSLKTPSTLFLDLNPDQYKNLLNYLHKHDKRFLFLNEIGTMSWKKSQINILKTTNSKIFQWNDLKNSKTNSSFLKNKKILQSRITKIFSDENFSSFFKIEGYSFWQIIKNDFVNFCMPRFYKSLELLELSKSFFAQTNIDSIVVLYHASLENKVVLHIAEKMNIQCFRLQHGLHAMGTVEKTMFPINFPDSQSNLKHLFWDENLKNNYSQMGMNKNNGIIIGSPRYDYLFQLDPKTNTNNILLTSTFLQNFASVNGYDSNILDIHKKTFQEICKIIHSISDKKLIIKLHPSMPPKYSIKSILFNIDSKIPIYRTQDITNLLIDSQVVICLDHSTVLLESMILKKPTITFMIDSSWYEHDPIITSGATLAVNSLEDFEKSLNKILFDSDFRKKLIQKGTEYVNNNLVNQGNSSIALGKLLISKHF